jgi:DNA-binding NarL/FixJ family response regulator
MRVLLADDHSPTRADLRDELAFAGFVVCAEAADGPSAVAAAERERPDVCILDVGMPGGGVETAAAIAVRVPGAQVVMLTVGRRDAFIESIRAGASGYLFKDMSPDSLARALRAVQQGEPAIPRRLVSQLLDAIRDQP